MEKIGSSRLAFSLNQRPPRLFKAGRGGSKQSVEVFEPYEENLPLEAGYYTFVLDADGRFRIKRGNFSSHASFVKGGPIGAAGQFRVNRVGNVAEVYCRSIDYWLIGFDARSPIVSFTINSFKYHHALELSPLAVFHFKSGKFDTFQLSIDRQSIGDLGERLRSLDAEGQGTEPAAFYTAEQRIAFSKYRPTPPERLFGIHKDQMTIDLETDESQSIEVGEPKPRLSVDQPPLTSGKKAFVIDPEGWLIVGHGHHILSGGTSVGAAGQFSVDPEGLISEINLNFSGHYRPDLSADYARYTFRALANHPLLSLADSCKITGRKFDDANVLSVNLRFSREELMADDPSLDQSIEYALI